MFEVANQPPPLEPYNVFTSDTVLRAALAREGAGWAEGELAALGATLGAPETVALGVAANRHPPELKSFDRFGHRLDEIEFHPAWHAMLAIAVGAGLHSSPWAKPQRGAHVARAAGTYMLTQIESGVYCPVAMTYGSVPALRQSPKAAAEWLPRICSRSYDRRFIPAVGKTGALIGMGMTENQGGSDLRTNVTRAEPADGGTFRLHGHKWFLSAPMCDAFLVLAQAPEGLSCFLVPRFTPDGARNAVHINRLKDKLGNKSNASSEVEFYGAYAEPIGGEGRGIPTILDMANYTRLDCVIGSAGLVRAALAQAVHHARHRTAFQKKLIDQPLMTNVLADLAVESEAAALLALRLARAYDEDDEAAVALRRVVTPAAKFYVCKRAPYAIVEAMEVLGGGGYIEESILPRLYREAPVNSIWEGSGNVMCLDVLRALSRTPGAADALRAELDVGDARVTRAATRLSDRIAAPGAGGEGEARVLVRDLVVTLQAALLVRHAPAYVADAFCAARLDGDSTVFGLLPRGIDAPAIVARAGPTV